MARACLELRRQTGVGGLLEGHPVDHATPALPGRHLLQQVPLAVEGTDAGRTKELVAREGVEVGIEGHHVDRHVLNRLGAVHEHPGADGMRHVRDLADRHDGAEDIGHLRHGDDPRHHHLPVLHLQSSPSHAACCLVILSDG